MSEQNKKVAVAFIEAMCNCDAAGADACLAPDARAVAKGFGKIAGVRHRDVMVGTIEAFGKLVPGGLRPTIQSVTGEGDRVVVEFEGNAKTRDGKPYCNQYCMVVTLSGGKVKLVNEYFCTILADEVMYPLIGRA